MKQVNHKGFTLIELLVVIAIIGVLSTLAAVALGNARVKSRDAKRLANVSHIMSALELYYNDAGSYPAAITVGEALSYGDTTYMNSVPTNPGPNNDGPCPANNNYAYESTDEGASYVVTFCIGGSVGDLPAGTNTATPSGLRN